MTDRSSVEAASFPPPLPAELYAAPQGRPQLGSLLLRDGAITLEQLEASLAEKEANGGRLGEILVRHGFASGSQVAQALADQHGLDYLDLGRFEVDPVATSLLPENIARRLGALPISFADDDVVLIAVSDPTDVIASDDLRLALGLQIRLAVVSADDLTRTRERCYGTNLSVEMEAFPEPPVAVEDIRDGMATNAPAIKLANQIISKAIEDGASDIHFEPQTHAMVVRARIDGVLRRVAEVPNGLQPAITSRLKIMGELDIADRRIPQDGRISIRYGGAPMDLRVAVLPTTYGEQVVLRILHRASGRLGLSDLGMNPEVEATFTRAVKQPYGAVRRRARGRPDRLRQDDDALRRARVPERRIQGAGDDRGSRRVPDSGRQPGRGERAVPASHSRAACARCSAPTPTCCSSARSATRRPRGSRSRPR